MELSTVNSPIPVAVDDRPTNARSVQEWRIQADAFRTADLHAVEVAEGASPYKDGAGGFQAKPEFRVAEIVTASRPWT